MFKLVSENSLLESQWILFYKVRLRSLLKQDVYIYVGQPFNETELNK
jgi:hypothetical protein